MSINENSLKYPLELLGSLSELCVMLTDRFFLLELHDNSGKSSINEDIVTKNTTEFVWI